MRIDPKQAIAGVPILEIRRLLRRSRDYDGWYPDLAEEVLGATKDDSAGIIATLKECGYIEEAAGSTDRASWRNTLKGNSLAMASAAKPIKRATAEKKLADFMDRVIQVRDSGEFLYKVDKVVLFGSYLSAADTLGDIDMAVGLAPKIDDREELNKLSERRGTRRAGSGSRVRQLSGTTDMAPEGSLPLLEEPLKVTQPPHDAGRCAAPRRSNQGHL